MFTESPRRRWGSRGRILSWGGAVALLMAAPGAMAEPDFLSDRFQISLGSFVLNNDVSVRLNGETEVGTNVDWERTVGDADTTRFRIDGQWRFAERHKVRFLWFNYSIDGSRVVEEEIDWGGETIPINARVDGESSFDVYELAYEYAFLRRDKYELAANIGLHYADLSLRLAARVDVNGDELERSVDEEATLAAPMPVIGLRGTWQLPHDFWLDASVQYFALSYQNYDGDLMDWRVGITWQPSKWVGIGLGYDRFNVNVDVEKESFNGSLDWTYQGPMIYYNVVF